MKVGFPDHGIKFRPLCQNKVIEKQILFPVQKIKKNHADRNKTSIDATKSNVLCFIIFGFIVY